MAHLSDNPARTIVIDARSPQEYAVGHISGAISVSWRLFSRVDSGKPGDPGWATLKSPSEISAVLSQFGIDARKQVIAYASPDSWGADGRIIWMLRMCAFPNSMLLEGGYQAWADAGKPVSTEVTKLAPLAVSVASVDQSLRVTTAKVVAGLGRMKLADVRSSEEYMGTKASGGMRAGHIPGAVSMPFTTLLKSNGTLADPSQLIAQLGRIGITPNDDVVVHSADGVQSAFATLVINGLGYKARNYDGSFYEWAGDKGRQVVKQAAGHD